MARAGGQLDGRTRLGAGRRGIRPLDQHELRLRDRGDLDEHPPARRRHRRCGRDSPRHRPPQRADQDEWPLPRLHTGRRHRVGTGVGGQCSGGHRSGVITCSRFFECCGSFDSFGVAGDVFAKHSGGQFHYAAAACQFASRHASSRLFTSACSGDGSRGLIRLTEFPAGTRHRRPGWLQPLGRPERRLSFPGRRQTDRCLRRAAGSSSRSPRFPC